MLPSIAKRISIIVIAPLAYVALFFLALVGLSIRLIYPVTITQNASPSPGSSRQVESGGGERIPSMFDILRKEIEEVSISPDQERIERETLLQQLGESYAEFLKVNPHFFAKLLTRTISDSKIPKDFNPPKGAVFQQLLDGLPPNYVASQETKIYKKIRKRMKASLSPTENFRSLQEPIELSKKIIELFPKEISHETPGFSPTGDGNCGIGALLIVLLNDLKRGSIFDESTSAAFSWCERSGMLSNPFLGKAVRFGYNIFSELIHHPTLENLHAMTDNHLAYASLTFFVRQMVMINFFEQQHEILPIEDFLSASLFGEELISAALVLFIRKFNINCSVYSIMPNGQIVKDSGVDTDSAAIFLAGRHFYAVAKNL